MTRERSPVRRRTASGHSAGPAAPQPPPRVGAFASRTLWLAPALALLGALGACGPRPMAEAEETPPADPVNEVEAEELFAQGLQLAQGGDLTRAEQYIGAAIVRGYPKDRALPLLMRVCIAASRLRVAIGYAEPYLDEHPRHWSLRLVVGSLYLSLDEPVKARRHLETVLRQKPDEPEAHYLMGLLMRDEVGDPTAAHRHFERYLELAPEGEHHEEAAHALATLRIPVRHDPNVEVEDGSDDEILEPGGDPAPAPTGDGPGTRSPSTPGAGGTGTEATETDET